MAGKEQQTSHAYEMGLENNGTCKQWHCFQEHPPLTYSEHYYSAAMWAGVLSSVFRPREYNSPHGLSKDVEGWQSSASLHPLSSCRRPPTFHFTRSILAPSPGCCGSVQGALGQLRSLTARDTLGQCSLARGPFPPHTGHRIALR